MTAMVSTVSDKPSKPTLCVAGKNDIAVNGLAYLRKHFNHLDICFLPNPSDTGVDTWQKSFRKYAEDSGTRQARIEELYSLEDLIFLSLEYSELIDTTKFKTSKLFNIHFSLLPKYKGMYTSALPIIHGEEFSGVTLHKIDDGIDTGGEIIEQIQFRIEPEDTARDLYFKYLENGFTLIRNNFEKLISGNFTAQAQPAVNASYFSKKSIDYKNLKINFFKTAFEVKNQFRGFTFREYQLPTYEGWEISRAEILTERSRAKPGTPTLETDTFFIVSTIDYDIKLLKDHYKLLWQSCESGNSQNLSLVLNKIPDLNLFNNKGWNALIIATYNGHLNMVYQLIDAGADIQSKNPNGTTLLMYALSHFQKTQDHKLFEFLLRRGADTTSKDRYGKTLKDYVYEKNCPQLLRFLD